MVQMKFLWDLKGVDHNLNIKQLDNAAVTCELSSNVTIMHEARKHNQMTLIFKEEEDKYLIDSDSKFREILERYENANKIGTVNQVLRYYATNNLEKIKE